MAKKRSIVGGIISDENNKRAVAHAVVKPVEKETRSARLYPLVKPSVKADFEKKAKDMGLTVNEVLNQLIEAWTYEDE